MRIGTEVWVIDDIPGESFIRLRVKMRTRDGVVADPIEGGIGFRTQFSLAKVSYLGSQPVVHYRDLEATGI